MSRIIESFTEQQVSGGEPKFFSVYNLSEKNGKKGGRDMHTKVLTRQRGIDLNRSSKELDFAIASVSYIVAAAGLLRLFLLVLL